MRTDAGDARFGDASVAASFVAGEWLHATLANHRLGARLFGCSAVRLFGCFGCRGDAVQQSTIARRVACRGTGLHRGEDVSLALCPAPANTGVVFVSLGGASGGGNVEFPATVDSLFSATRATTLAVSGSGIKVGCAAPGQISTVEHLLATLLAFQIDNVRIEVSGTEIPAMDGSAAPFVNLIRSAGKESLAADTPSLRDRGAAGDS